VVAEIVEGLDATSRARVQQLRTEGRFFWVDVTLADTTRDDLAVALGIPADAFGPLLGFGDEIPPMRKFYGDAEHVAFAMSCYLPSSDQAGDSADGLQPVEVHLVVTGGYLLTLHQEQVSLPTLLAPYSPEGRTEQYVVYAILEAMVISAFEELNEIELTLDDLAAMSANLQNGRVRIATLRMITDRLRQLRRRVGPERGLFERLGVELEGLEGLDADGERYFDRFAGQVNRLVEAIDAAENAMANLLQLRLNETSYWLTVVATIFLPLTFITGFFGMNFGWMVGEIHSPLAFWLLGVGSLVLGVIVIWKVVVRESPVEPEPRSRLALRRSR